MIKSFHYKFFIVFLLELCLPNSSTKSLTMSQYVQRTEIKICLSVLFTAPLTCTVAWPSLANLHQVCAVLKQPLFNNHIIFFAVAACALLCKISFPSSRHLARFCYRYSAFLAISISFSRSRIFHEVHRPSARFGHHEGQSQWMHKPLPDTGTSLRVHFL